jgi:hypothetical protein
VGYFSSPAGAVGLQKTSGTLPPRITRRNAKHASHCITAVARLILPLSVTPVLLTQLDLER